MHYDVIIIGAGPGGIYSAYELTHTRKDLRVAVFETGNPLHKRKCPIDGKKIKSCIHCKTCAIMNGFGGAGAFSDGKYNITNQFGGTLHEHIGKNEAIELMLSLIHISVRVAVTSGLANARKLLEKIKSGEADYQMVEVMACPGGCINGGGQPVQSDSVRNYTDLKALRSAALYQADQKNALRQSGDNPRIQTLYEEFLDAPGKPRAHMLLHTTYVRRNAAGLPQPNPDVINGPLGESHPKKL